MPIFEIEQYELHTAKYRVEAKNEAQAIARLFNGEADLMDNSLEYIEVADDYGMPVDQNRDTGGPTSESGHRVGDDIIPSVRTITKSGVMDHGSSDEEQRCRPMRSIKSSYTPRATWSAADSEADALERFFRGEGKQDLTSIENAGIANDYGLSLAERPGLASELLDRGVINGDDTSSPPFEQH